MSCPVVPTTALRTALEVGVHLLDDAEAVDSATGGADRWRRSRCRPRRKRRWRPAGCCAGAGPPLPLEQELLRGRVSGTAVHLLWAPGGIRRPATAAVRRRRPHDRRSARRVRPQALPERAGGCSPPTDSSDEPTQVLSGRPLASNRGNRTGVTGVHARSGPAGHARGCWRVTGALRRLPSLVVRRHLARRLHRPLVDSAASLKGSEARRGAAGDCVDFCDAAGGSTAGYARVSTESPVVGGAAGRAD